MEHWDRLRLGGEELRVIWICRIGQDPMPTSGSCHGNHERKEGVEWKIEQRVPDHCGVAAHRPNRIEITSFYFLSSFP
jgi:hypothetical protein